MSLDACTLHGHGFVYRQQTEFVHVFGPGFWHGAWGREGVRAWCDVTSPRGSAFRTAHAWVIDCAVTAGVVSDAQRILVVTDNNG